MSKHLLTTAIYCILNQLFMYAFAFVSCIQMHDTAGELKCC